MNGLFATIGGVAAVLFALALGFRATMLVAIGMYALAWVTFAALRRGNRLQEAADVERAGVKTETDAIDRTGVAALWNTSSSSASES